MQPVAAAVVAVAKAMGSEAAELWVAEAAQMVITEAMQVETLGAAQAEIVEAVQAMGCREAGAAIISGANNDHISRGGHGTGRS
mgnify:CR=1 FL=1